MMNNINKKITFQSNRKNDRSEKGIMEAMSGALEKCAVA
jgi:hypothetical protein